jgi:hypothetical protein
MKSVQKRGIAREDVLLKHDAQGDPTMHPVLDAEAEIPAGAPTVADGQPPGYKWHGFPVKIAPAKMVVQIGRYHFDAVVSELGSGSKMPGLHSDAEAAGVRNESGAAVSGTITILAGA